MDEIEKEKVEKMLAEGDVAKYNKNYEEALLKYGEALKRGEDSNQQGMISEALARMGHVHLDLNRLSAAEKCYCQSVAIAQKINNYELYATCVNNLFRIKVMRKDLLKCKEEFQEILGIFVAAKDFRRIGWLILNYSAILGENQQFKAAEDILKIAEQYLENLDFTLLHGRIQFNPRASLPWYEEI